MAMSTDNGKDYFVKDFYERTLKLLEEYHGKNDVANLINCMVGLLIVPKERYFKSKRIPDDFLEEELLNNIRATIPSDPNICLTQMLRRLRNSVAHGNMEIKAEQAVLAGEPMKIGSVVFKDENNFYAEIPIELLKAFLTSFAAKICKRSEGDV